MREVSVTAQAMEICGGARVDCEEKSFVAGESARDSARLVSTFCWNGAVTGGCVFAHCGVVTARQPSWWQQLVSRMER